MEKHVASVDIFSLFLTECLQNIYVHLKSKSQTPNLHNRTGPQKTEAKTRLSPPAVGPRSHRMKAVLLLHSGRLLAQPLAECVVALTDV